MKFYGYNKRRFTAMVPERMKHMAAAQKKTSNTTKRTTGAAASRSSAGSKSAAGSRTKTPSPKPIRREIGAVVCFLLALFTLLGLFNVEAIVIDLLCGSDRKSVV